MASLLYGLVIAVFWGCADMQCSLIPGNSRRVALLAHSVGLIALTGFGIATRGYPSFLTLFSCNERMLLLLSSFGLLSAFAYFCLYRALQSAAPAGVISAILSANGAVSVLASVVFFHEYDGRVILILGILLAGVLLAAMSQTRISLHAPGIVYALVAMVALGGFNFGIGFVVSTGTLDWFPLLFGTRAFSLLFLVLAFAFSPRPTTQRGGRLDGRSCLLAGGTGLTEMIGLLLFSLVAHLHLDLALTSAIASCSSIVPLIASFVSRRYPLSFPAPQKTPEYRHHCSGQMESERIGNATFRSGLLVAQEERSLSCRPAVLPGWCLLTCVQKYALHHPRCLDFLWEADSAVPAMNKPWHVR